MKIKSALIVFLAGLTAAASAYAADVTGKVVFEGAAPTPATINTGADPTCKMAHPKGLTSDDVIVNSNGTLKDVFIYVKDGLGDKKFPAPTTPVEFNQEGCQYHPKVFGIQAGQPLEIINSDNTLHNVHALPKNSQSFNLGMPIKGMKLKKTFDKPEIMVKIKCEVHPWMSAYAGVVDNPFFGVSDDQGKFDIKNLPPGTYTLEAWHEKYGTQEEKVTITDDKSQDVTFTFKAS